MTAAHYFEALGLDLPKGFPKDKVTLKLKDKHNKSETHPIISVFASIRTKALYSESDQKKVARLEEERKAAFREYQHLNQNKMLSKRTHRQA